MNYADFVRAKTSQSLVAGFEPGDLSRFAMFPHQDALSSWAIRRGRAAIFAATGLGKTRMEVAWAQRVAEHTAGNVLMLAPLAVAEQTVAEAASIGVTVTHARTVDDIRPGINITNYERLHRFDASQFAGMVGDESSIIKHHDAKTFTRLSEAFADTPYKLCATATPSPNDWTELGTHAEFLGVRSRVEMLAEFFVHDGAETQVWRLKGHARKEFWRWVASWGAMLQSPEDLGFDGAAYRLPPLTVHQHIIDTGVVPAGQLFAVEAQTLSERRDARRSTIDRRVDECAAMVRGDSQPWIVWCDLNAEGEALRKAIPGAVEIRGSDDTDDKEERLLAFAAGKIKTLITKPSIAGFGLNWQHCARMAFVGVTDSFEAYYQAVRRCWRFGQKREVQVHVFASDLEGAVIANLRRKEQDAEIMAKALAAETSAYVLENVRGIARESNPYEPAKAIAVPPFLRSAA